MATEKVEILQVNTEPSKVSVKDLRKEMKSLKDELLNLDEGTAEYNATLQKAAGIQHTLKEQMEEVNASAMDTGQILGNATNAVAGITSAFQVGTAAMNLMGIESETSMKAIQEMQNVMALTQGLAQIEESAKAFKRLGNAVKASALFNKLFIKTTVESTAATTANATAQIVGSKATDVGTKSVWKFNTALLANPIMWIVAGITAAVAAIGALIVATNKAETAQGDFNAELERTKRLQEDLELSQSEEIQLMIARGATEREIMDQRIKDASTNLDNANALVDKLTAVDGVRNEEQQQKFDEALANQKKYSLEFRQVGIDSAALDIKTTVEAEKEKAAAIKEANDKALVKKQKQIEDDKALVAKAEEELKNKRQSDLQNALDDENEKYEKEKAAYIRQNKDITELKAQHEKDIKKIEDDAAAEAKAKKEADTKATNEKIVSDYQTTADLELKNKQYALEQKRLLEMQAYANGESNKETYLANIKALDDQTQQNELTSLQAQLDNKAVFGAMTEQQQLDLKDKILAIKKEQGEESVKITEETAKTEEELEKEKANALMKIAGALSGALAGAADLAEEGSKEQKALKISSAIIDGILGGISAFTGMVDTIPGPAGLIAGAIAASTVAMSVAASIKKMAAVKVGKKGGGGGGASMPPINLSAMAASQAPVQATTQVTGASTESVMQDNRVYVVESDITNTQRKVSTAESEATF